MPKFDTEKIEAINAKELVEQLLINGKRVLDAFEKNLIGTTYQAELVTIYKYVEFAANGNSLPEKKLRKYRGNKDGITEYEFKSKHLRLWAIQRPNKKIIVFGGFKNSQSSDASTFRSLKNQYLESLKKM